MELSYKQAQELLQGTAFKALDCKRKSVLRLAAEGTIGVWMAFWMAEDERREAWVSLDELERQTGLTQKTIRDHIKKLIADGWLRETGRTAADKLIELGRKPSRGSHNVKVYFVDDPTDKAAKRYPPKNYPVNVLQEEIPPKVLLGSPLLSSSSVGLGSIELPSAPTASGDEDEGKPKPQNPEPTPTAFGVWRKGKRMCASDGTPWPDKHTWDVVMTNAQRLEWLETHDSNSIDYEPEQYVPVHLRESGPSVPKEKDKTKGNASEPPSSTPPPTCSCGGEGLYRTKNGYLCNACYADSVLRNYERLPSRN